ncbi:MAG: cation:proton antiporter [Chloroflexota bacterium]|nr:cation:proton antiporter [Chloroflexota bacterium]
MESTTTLMPLAILLVAAKLAGAVSARFGMPSVVGKILVGVLLGPSVFGLFRTDALLSSVASVGVILLMFMAGVETDLVQMRQVGVTALLVACGGVLVPMGGGIALMRMWGYAWPASVFVGVVLTATSVSVTAQTLKELGRLRSRVGTVILGAAVIDDVLGIILLSIVIGLDGGENPLRPLLSMGIFFLIAFAIGEWVMPHLFHHLTGLKSREASLALVLALVIVAAWAAESLGKVAAITGAYLFGLAVARRPAAEQERITYGIDLLGYGLFVPVFFVVVGLEANSSAITAAPLFTALLIAVAVLTKAVGAFAGGLAGRLPKAEAITVGVGMVTRGEVALVVATLGKETGILNGQLFAASLAMVLLTTIATPVLLRFVAAPHGARPVIAQPAYAAEDGTAARRQAA